MASSSSATTTTTTTAAAAAAPTPARTVRVAVTNHEPAWLDLAAGVAKTVQLIAEAGARGVDLLAFPETWLIGYPAWIWSRPVDFDLGVRYVQNSLVVGDGEGGSSAELQAIQRAAAEHEVAVSLGFSERRGDSVWIAQALIDRAGRLRVARRKMKPTHMERTVFGDASGDCLSDVVDVDGVGRIGALCCWEHIQPLLKFYTFAQAEQIHVAAWPVLDPFVDGSPAFWSMSVEGTLSISQNYAVESQAFVLHATTVLSDAGIELMDTKGSPLMGSPNKGSSAIIGPDGRILAGGINSPSEQLVVADIDLAQVTKCKTFADSIGHYSRPDLMWVGVDKKQKSVVVVKE